MPSLMAILGLDGRGFHSGLREAQDGAKSAGQAIQSSLGRFAIIGTAGAGVYEAVQKFQEGHDKVVEFAEAMENMSGKLGISTEAVQAWDYALKLNGATIDQAATFFNRLATARKKAMEGDDKAVASFRALGVTLDDLKGKRLEDLGLQISKAFELGDPQKLLADLREIGGRGAGELAGAFHAGLGNLVVNAKDLGIVIDDDTLQKLKEANEELKTLELQKQAARAPLDLAEERTKSLFRRGVAVIGRMLGGASANGVEGAKQAAQDYAAELEKQSAEIQAKRKQPKFTGGADEGENKKAERAAEQALKRREELEERLSRMQDRHYLDSLTKEERITELHRQRVKLAEWMADNWSKMTEEGRLQAEIDVEELQGEEDRAQRDLDKPKAGQHHGDMARNALQAIGAYGAMNPHEQQMLDVSRRSEGHLQRIEQHLAKGQGTPHNRGVHF